MKPSDSTGAKPRRQQLGVAAIDYARSRFFPSWSNYIGTRQESLPLYRVIVNNTADLELAKSVQPDVVEADYVLVDMRPEQPASPRRS